MLSISVCQASVHQFQHVLHSCRAFKAIKLHKQGGRGEVGVLLVIAQSVARFHIEYRPRCVHTAPKAQETLALQSQVPGNCTT